MESFFSPYVRVGRCPAAVLCRAVIRRRSRRQEAGGSPVHKHCPHPAPGSCSSRHWPRRSWGRCWHRWRGWWRSPWPPWSARPAPRAAPSWPEVRETLLTTVMSSHCIVFPKLRHKPDFKWTKKDENMFLHTFTKYPCRQAGRFYTIFVGSINSQFCISKNIPACPGGYSIRVPVHIWIFGLMYSKMMLIKIDCLWYRQEMLMVL